MPESMSVDNDSHTLELCRLTKLLSVPFDFRHKYNRVLVGDGYIINLSLSR